MAITRIGPVRTGLPILTGILLSGSVLTSGAGAAPAHHPAQGSIKSVVLTTVDVAHIYGGTFKPFIDGVISNKYLASTEKTAIASGLSVASSGRVTGYDSVWISGSRTNHLSVTNAVNEYRSSSYPHLEFSQFTHRGKTPKGFRLTSFSGVGDEALMLTSSRGRTGGLGIIFRRGRYLVDVIVGAQHGTLSLSRLTKLAAIEDQRIQAHG
ncbi:MAG: hypothetical protein M3Z66_21625 [Chloroflexota bacterium]|nr:hypothetical protein [Chloroflexota bacterium]